MFGVVFRSLWAVANSLLANRENAVVERPPVTSRWRRWTNTFLSMMSNFGVPLLQTVVEQGTVYDFVNAALSQQTPTRTAERRDPQHGLNRLSRPNFRRRAHRQQRPRIVLINPTINVTVQQP